MSLLIFILLLNCHKIVCPTIAQHYQGCCVRRLPLMETDSSLWYLRRVHCTHAPVTAPTLSVILLTAFTVNGNTSAVSAACLPYNGTCPNTSHCPSTVGYCLRRLQLWKHYSAVSAACRLRYMSQLLPQHSLGTYSGSSNNSLLNARKLTVFDSFS